MIEDWNYILLVSEKGERALVFILTKRSSEDLADYLRKLKFKVRYIHSELNTFERAELIRDLRKGDVQILVGINLSSFTSILTSTISFVNLISDLYSAYNCKAHIECCIHTNSTIRTLNKYDHTITSASL